MSGMGSARAYNSGSSNEQFILVGAHCTAVCFCNLSGADIQVWDAATIDQSPSDLILTLPPGITKVDWHFKVGIVVELAAGSGASVSYC